jgi:hypothetical protein
MFECSLNELVRSIIYALPVLLILAGNSMATQEFHVYRMQQFDIPLVAAAGSSGSGSGGGGFLGSRATAFSMEARTVNSKPSFISRRCVLVKLDEFTLERYRTLASNYVGAIVVILPKAFSASQRQVVSSLETNLLQEEVYYISFLD